MASSSSHKASLEGSRSTATRPFVLRKDRPTAHIRPASLYCFSHVCHEVDEPITEFTCFPKLPQEIRDEIWKLSMPADYQVINIHEIGKKRHVKNYPARALYQACQDSRRVTLQHFQLSDFAGCLEHPILVNPEKDIFQFQARRLQVPLHESQWGVNYTNHLLPRNMADELETVVFFLGNQRLMNSIKLVSVACVFRGLKNLIIVREKKDEPLYLTHNRKPVLARHPDAIDWIKEHFHLSYLVMVFRRKSLLTKGEWLDKLGDEIWNARRVPKLIWMDRATYKKRMKWGNGVQGLLGKNPADQKPSAESKPSAEAKVTLEEI